MPRRKSSDPVGGGEDGLVRYLSSETHQRRMAGARQRMTVVLANFHTTEGYAALSESMGALEAISQFYRNPLVRGPAARGHSSITGAEFIDPVETRKLPSIASKRSVTPG